MLKKINLKSWELREKTKKLIPFEANNVQVINQNVNIEALMSNWKWLTLNLWDTELGKNWIKKLNLIIP